MARLNQEPGGRTPAPGRLALVQAFVNSVDLEDGPDAFATLSGLQAWLGQVGREDDGVALTEADRIELVSLREGLRAVIASHSGGTPDPDAVRTVNAAFGARSVNILLDCGGEPIVRADPELGGIDRVVARLAIIVAHAEATGTWQRLRICKRDICQWAFYDASKNHSGLWCSMATCGSRVKTHAYRKRQTQPD